MQVMVGCHGRPLIAAIMVKSLRFGLRIWESAITSSAPTNYAIKKTGSDCHEGIVREKKSPFEAFRCQAGAIVNTRR